mgnify:CR=1 FL=1
MYQQELVEKQRELIEKFSFNLKNKELLVPPYPFQSHIEEVNGLYKEYKETQLEEDEVGELGEKIEILKHQLSQYQNDEWEYSTRQDFLEVFQGWLMEEDEETDDEVSFHQTPSQLVLKIKSSIDDGFLKMTFTKEYENQGETNETV